MKQKYHRAFGCYGIIGTRNDLIVIKKLGGPYVNRFDLPGGSLEDGEGLEQCAMREVNEETGLTVAAMQQIGVVSFRYPWDYEEWHYNQHICVFYRVEKASGHLQHSVAQFDGQDALGAVKVPLGKLSMANSSPLVLKAKEYLLDREHFTLTEQTLTQWQVLDQPVF